MPSPAPALRTAGGSLPAYVAYFLSGASSLIFQTLWTRMLHHVFGATSVAISTVLTVFMAGLGLGAWLGGKYANRIKHPIITYAVAEIGIGIFGLLTPLLVRPDGWLAAVNGLLRAELGSDSGLFMVARFLCVAPILIVPTTMMGATFPLLTRHFVSVGEDARAASSRVGILYAINTFGASTGPLLSAFFLLPTVGLMWANVVACSMNFALAALIFIARKPLLGSSLAPGERLRFWPEKRTFDKEEEEEEAAPSSEACEESRRPGELPIPELARKIAFICFAASGAASLCYEVVWSRALAMTIGSSIYSFALILETFLIGIAAGSAAMSAFMGERARPLLGLAITSVALIFLANVPWAIDLIDPADTTQRFSGSWAHYLVLSALYAGPVLLALLWSHRRTSSRVPDFRAPGSRRATLVVVMAAMPVVAASINALRFPGYLPKIVLSVVAAVAVFLVLASLLSRAPSLLLAIVQLFIAGATLVSYIWQDEIPRAFAQLVASIPSDQLPDHVGVVKLFMFLTVVLCTLPATLGMGAMFPLTMRVWTSGGARIAKDVASVYTANTLGSILGSWLPGFVLFALVGAERTLHLGIALNMALALAMLIAGVADPEEDQRFWSWRRLSAIGLPVVAAVTLAASAFPMLGGDWRWWVRAFGAVAFGALALVEYVWLRGRTEGRPSKPSITWAMVIVPLLAGFAIAFTMVELRATDPWALRAVHWAARILVLGVGLFAAYANWREDREGADRASTSAHRDDATSSPARRGDEPEDLPLWHTITVYVLAPLIPALLALLWVGTKDHDSVLRWDRTHMTLGVFRLSLARDMLDEQAWGTPDLVYYNDGLTTTVSVERWGRHYAMKNNGKVDASNGDDMPTQINVAAYPLLMHPDGPSGLDVVIIGFGSGVSVGTALKFPVKRVDVVELESAVIEAGRFFDDVSHLEYTLDHWPYVEMDRLEVINDDGRNYLAATQRQYDVIISEPSNPWITGVSDLFTVDHWRITKQRLRPGGIYCQWVQLYELSPQNIKTIYRTFASQFEHVIVLSADTESSDTVMLGSDRPIELDLERLERAFALPGVAEELARAQVYSPYDFIARSLLATRDEVLTYTQIEEHRRGTQKRLFGLFESERWEPFYSSTNIGRCEPPNCRRVPAELNTDDNARIELAAPNDLIGFQRYAGYLGTVYSDEWPFGLPRPPVEGESTDGRLTNFGEGEVASRHYAELALSLIANGRRAWGRELIRLSIEAGPTRESEVAAAIEGLLSTVEHEPPVRIEPPVPGPEMDRATAEELVQGFDRVRDAIDRNDYRAAFLAIESVPAPLRLHSGPGMRLLYGYLLYKAAEGSYAQYRSAVEQLDSLAREEEDYVLRHPEVYYYLARSLLALGENGAALERMRTYVEMRLVDGADRAEPGEPAPHQAPTTDAVGESDKSEHVGR